MLRMNAEAGGPLILMPRAGQGRWQGYAWLRRRRKDAFGEKSVGRRETKDDGK
jgi:hypothetical protein